MLIVTMTYFAMVLRSVMKMVSVSLALIPVLKRSVTPVRKIPIAAMTLRALPVMMVSIAIVMIAVTVKETVSTLVIPAQQGQTAMKKRMYALVLRMRIVMMACTAMVLRSVMKMVSVGQVRIPVQVKTVMRRMINVYQLLLL